MDPCIYSTQRGAQKNIHGEETPLRTCCKELCPERAAFIGCEIVAETREEEEERSEAERFGQEEEGQH